MTHAMGAEVLIVARESDRWVDAVAGLAREHFQVTVASPEASVDTSQVRILIGAPPDLRSRLAHCPKLAWIQSTWAGIDALREHMSPSLTITPLKGVFGASMSEFVLGWLLALERNIIVRAHQKHWLPEVEGNVVGKRLGIMGAGDIGSEVAHRARAFGLEVTGLNSSGEDQPGFTRCYATDARDEFACGLDYLVSILPATQATDGIVNDNLLARLAPGAIFMNVGRGNAVVEADLAAALQRGALRYAVLDVFEEEPLADDHPLWHTPGVFITSHTAAPTPDTAIPAVFARNLKQFLAGAPLKGAVDPRRGY
ncbi:MAG: D-2-hydroxyacid dehydrogenase [Luminiphilus sp.]|nr:D-2-hydroxyacid dehydrogenase [Luminiphilus sp.]